ncbi:MAG: hypothetical protein JWR19_2241 [Pedosphaera sp.]|nr:hypothetical protein [Pedosphaera sp.]
MFDLALSLSIRLASTAVILGWLLSAFGQLNFRGYLLAGIPAVVVVTILSWRKRGVGPCRFALGRRLARWWQCRRLLPLIYVLTVALIIISSLLHEPNNFDSLSYRMPKVLYWLDQHRWHWIDAPYEPINYSLPNYEWLTVPLYLITGGFHSAVVINWISFLFLPALFFSLLRVFGASRRVAYDWMWLFPSGYLITMQAGGIGNDLPALTALLAALYCAHRFASSAKGDYLLDALLAAGFCTGMKLSNLPLAAFVLIFLLKDPRRLFAKPLRLAIATVLGVLVSALIPLLLSLAYSGSILGTTMVGNTQPTSPAAGWLGNSLMMLVAAFAPPLFPSANQITALLEQGLGHGLLSWLQLHYVKFTLRLNELPQEEAGALGLGITLALILSAAFWLRARKAGKFPARRPQLLRWQQLAWWSWLTFSLLVLFARLGTGTSFPRNLLPWFPLLLAPLVAGISGEQISRSRIWRGFAPLVSLSVLPAIVLSPARPLVPPATLIHWAQKIGMPAASLERLSNVYAAYAVRADSFASLRNEWPPETRVLGLVSDGGEPTADFWKPYGSHRCVYLLSEAQISAAQKDGVQYVVLQELGCQKFFNMDSVQWLAVHHAQIIKTAEVMVLSSSPPQHYTLAKLGTAGLDSASTGANR